MKLYRWVDYVIIAFFGFAGYCSGGWLGSIIVVAMILALFLGAKYLDK
jgi:hypothetical protein